MNNSIYFGSWNGSLFSINASSGLLRWASVRLTNNVSNAQPCANHGGIYSTPTYWNNTLYITAGSSYLYAINPSNGSILWKQDTANFSTQSKWYYHLIESSTIIYNGSAYVGISSACDHLPYNSTKRNNNISMIQGQLLMIPLTGPSHVPTHIFNVTTGASYKYTGGGIWSTGSVDPARNTIWVTTGNAIDNATSQGPYPYTDAILGLFGTLHEWA